MNKFPARRLAALLAVAFPLVAVAAPSNEDLKTLREELQRMRDAYEQRINALEQRLAKAEDTVEKADASAARAERTASAGNSAPVSASAFNPEISLILSGMYTNLKDNPAKRPYQLQGFVPSNGEVAPPPRGFSLGESELGISANVDHYFRGQLTLALPSEEGAGPEVEEAFIQTQALASGLNLKAGRFLSGIGYLNEQHAHTWDFSDTPLAYKAFFGGQQRGEGLQLKWVAPTDTFFELGAEGGKGGSFPSSEREKNGFQTGSLFAHMGGDLGISHNWRAGLSYVSAKPDGRSYEDTDSAGNGTLNEFSGNSKTWIADAVWKWAPDGNSTQRYLKLQGEYFWRKESGTLASDSPLCGGSCSGAYRSEQNGWYAQAVYKFAPAWRLGYRYDRLNSGQMDIGLVNGGALSRADLPVLVRHNPNRNTAMVDWSPSEFSLVRFQYARDESRAGAPDDQLWMHYIVSLGAHGAHKY